MKKILVIINKNWETEPVLNALTNPKLRPAALPFPEVINTPCDGDNRMSQPRAVFSLPREGEEPLQVVVRCIEDLMATGVNTSSSLEKYKVLPQAIAADAADLIISVSTANYPDPAAFILAGGLILPGCNGIFDDLAINPNQPSMGAYFTSPSAVNDAVMTMYGYMSTQRCRPASALRTSGFDCRNLAPFSNQRRSME